MLLSSVPKMELIVQSILQFFSYRFPNRLIWQKDYSKNRKSRIVMWSKIYLCVGCRSFIVAKGIIEPDYLWEQSIACLRIYYFLARHFRASCPNLNSIMIDFFLLSMQLQYIYRISVLSSMVLPSRSSLLTKVHRCLIIAKQSWITLYLCTIHGSSNSPSKLHFLMISSDKGSSPFLINSYVKGISRQKRIQRIFWAMPLKLWQIRVMWLCWDCSSSICQE